MNIDASVLSKLSVLEKDINNKNLPEDKYDSQFSRLLSDNKEKMEQGNQVHSLQQLMEQGNQVHSLQQLDGNIADQINHFSTRKDLENFVENNKIEFDAISGLENFNFSINFDLNEIVIDMKWFATGALSYGNNMIDQKEIGPFSRNSAMISIHSNDGNPLLFTELPKKQIIVSSIELRMNDFSGRESQRDLLKSNNAQKSQLAHLSMPEYLKKKLTIHENMETEQLKFIIRDYTLTNAEISLVKKSIQNFLEGTSQKDLSLIINGKNYL